MAFFKGDDPSKEAEVMYKNLTRGLRVKKVFKVEGQQRIYENSCLRRYYKDTTTDYERTSLFFFDTTLKPCVMDEWVDEAKSSLKSLEVPPMSILNIFSFCFGDLKNPGNISKFAWLYCLLQSFQIVQPQCTGSQKEMLLKVLGTSEVNNIWYWCSNSLDMYDQVHVNIFDHWNQRDAAEWRIWATYFYTGIKPSVPWYRDLMDMSCKEPFLKPRGKQKRLQGIENLRSVTFEIK